MAVCYYLFVCLLGEKLIRRNWWVFSWERVCTDDQTNVNTPIKRVLVHATKYCDQFKIIKRTSKEYFFIVQKRANLFTPQQSSPLFLRRWQTTRQFAEVYPSFAQQDVVDACENNNGFYVKEREKKKRKGENAKRGLFLDAVRMKNIPAKELAWQTWEKPISQIMYISI